MGTPQPGGPAHGDLVADVVGAAGLVLGTDHVQAEQFAPSAACPSTIGSASAPPPAALPLERPDLDPDGPDHPHEEQPQQDDHAVLERTEYRCVVGRSGKRNQDQMHRRSGAGLQEVSNRRTVVPITIWSPSASFRSRMVAPLTRVPLVELRSTTHHVVADAPDLGVATAGVGVGDHDRTLGEAADGEGLGAEDDPGPSARTIEAAGRPGGPSCTSETTANRPRRCRVSSMTETVTGPTKT